MPHFFTLKEWIVPIFKQQIKRSWYYLHLNRKIFHQIQGNIKSYLVYDKNEYDLQYNLDYEERMAQIYEYDIHISLNTPNSFRRLRIFKITSCTSANPKILQQYITTLLKWILILIQ